MTKRPTATSRAYQLVDSGQCEDILALRSRLSEEGYGRDTVQGRRLVTELSRRCRQAVDTPIENRAVPRIRQETASRLG